MDSFIREKGFWQNKQAVMLVMAATDLLMSVCLDLALYVQYVQDSMNALNEVTVVELLASRLVFCVRRIMTFRRLIWPRLTLPYQGYLEESAMHLLRLSTLAYPGAANILTRLQGSGHEGPENRTSKELLLLQATQLGLTDLMKEAIASGAVPDRAIQTANQQKTALEIAVTREDKVAAMLLVDAKADISRPDKSEQNMTTLTGRGYTFWFVELLFSRNEAVSTKHVDYDTALCTASSQGSAHTVESLLNVGADPNARYGAYTTTALQEATYRGHTRVVELLLSFGANVNAPQTVTVLRYKRPPYLATRT